MDVGRKRGKNISDLKFEISEKGGFKISYLRNKDSKT